VWTTCLVFFQSVLLAGYAYADLTTRLGARRQALLHVALLAVSLACLPIIASSGWKPRGDEEPISEVRKWELTQHLVREPYQVGPVTDANGVPRRKLMFAKARARVSRFYFEDRVVPPTPAEVRELESSDHH